MTLTDFLFARVEELERMAECIQSVTYHDRWITHPGGEVEHVMPPRAIAGLRPWILAESEVKRRILGEHHHETSDYSEGVACVVCSWNTSTGGMEYEPNGWCLTLRFLALPYADHEDFKEEWRA